MTSIQKRTFWLALCAASIVALTPSGAMAAEGDVKIREVTVDNFPKVEVIVSAGEELEPTELSIQEATSTVAKAKIEPLNESGQIVDVVLVIDTSGSMEGEPMAAALSAASSFVAEVPKNVRVGVVSFADGARRVSGFSAETDQTIAAINSLTATGETAMFDGVRTATKMFDGDNQRNIVLLSDGGDTASESSLKAAGDAAQRSKAAIFAVGLKTTETDIEALKALSSSTGGRYQPAGTADLSNVYGSIAEELASQFAISYRSSVGSGQDIAIEVLAPGGSDNVTVLAPRGIDVGGDKTVDAPPAEAPEPLPGWFLPLVLILCFGAVFWISLTIVGTRLRKEREGRLRRALSDSMTATSSDNNDNDEDDSAANWLPELLVSAGGQVTSQGFREKLDIKLERGSVALRPDEFAGLSIAAGIVGFVIGSLLFSSALFSILIAAVGFMAPSVWLSGKIKHRLAKINDQIPDILTVLASSLRAGHSFLQALDMVAHEVDDPGASEFQRAVAEIRLGRSVTEALEAMAERINSEGFSWAILAVNIQREVGGNLAEVLDTVAATIRTRDMLRRQAKTLAAEGRLSMYVLSALPVAIAVYIKAVNPDYIGMLFEDDRGRVMLAAGIALMIAGWLWMRKVVKIDV